MTTEPQPLAEITQTALKVLYREIGVVNTVRFINQFTTGYGDSVDPDFMVVVPPQSESL